MFYFSETLALALCVTLTLTFKIGIMSAENISSQEEKEQTTEQHDCHIQTGNMSGENTSYTKRKQETPQQCDSQLKKAKGKARH